MSSEANEPTGAAGASELLGRFESALALLEELDPSTLEAAAEHELVAKLTRWRDRFEVAKAALVNDWEQRGAWGSDGSKSAAARLAQEAKLSAPTARRDVSRARHLRRMPATSAAVRAGQLSLDHVDLLMSADRPWRSAVFSTDEAMLVKQCARQKVFSDARRVVAYWMQRADAVAGERDAEYRRESAHVHASPLPDGTVVLNGRLDPVGGGIFTTELERLEQQLYTRDQREGRERTASQRRAEALVEMAKRSAAMPSNARSRRPLVSVLVGDQQLSQLCELEDGTVLAPSDLLALLRDADLESVIFDGADTVLSVSKRRTFSGALRRAIEVRDRRCQHTAGCEEPPGHCDVDHIVPYGQGGVTSQFNGRLLCQASNRNPEKRDRDATPRPERDIGIIDLFRARIRWGELRDHRRLQEVG
jgi:hypothetical protein